jgi:hypothetical protein
LEEDMIRKTIVAMSFGLLAAAGCTTESGQTLSGRVQASTFPEQITRIEAVGLDTAVDAAVAADGSFTLTLPVHDSYRIQLVSTSHRADLVYPRTAGTYETSLAIAGDGEFQLGDVQYLALEDGNGGAQDAAVAENTPDASLGDDGVKNGGDTGTGGGQDTGGGGQDTGGGGQDTGGGGQDTGGGGQDTGGGTGH